ncbi:MAG: ankyrin repeat domain-containing protein [Chlamydiae bacterium]|nr:ankyrin repeat domain-containing protein [Chlamydiota bacterium]
MAASASTSLTIFQDGHDKDLAFRHLQPEGSVFFELDNIPQDHTVTQLFFRVHGSEGGESCDFGNRWVHNRIIAEKISASLTPDAVVYLESCYSAKGPNSLARQILNKIPDARVYGFKTLARVYSSKHGSKYLMEGSKWDSPYFPFESSLTCSTFAKKTQLDACKTEFATLKKLQSLSCFQLIDFFDKHQSALFCSEHNVDLTIDLIILHYNLLFKEMGQNPTASILLFQCRLLLNSLPSSDQQKFLFDKFINLLITKAIQLFNEKKIIELQNLFGQPSCKSDNPIDWQLNRTYDSLSGLEALWTVQKFTDEKILPERILNYAQDQNVHKQTLLMVSIKDKWPNELIQKIMPLSDVNAVDDNMQTPLMFAAIDGNVDIVNALLAAGAKLNAKDNNGKTALIFASNNKHFSIRDILIKAIKASLQYSALMSEKYGSETLLMISIKDRWPNGLIQEIILLSDVNAADDKMQTPLMFAALNGNVDIVNALLAAGAKLDAKDKEGKNALIFALNKNHFSICDILIKAIIALPQYRSVMLEKYEGKTILMLCIIKHCDIEIIKQIIPFSDVNAEDADYQTPLMLAVENWDKASVEALIAAGAKLDAKDKKGKTALFLAIEKKFLPIVDLLIQAIIDSPKYHSLIFNERYSCNDTLLMIFIDNHWNIKMTKRIIPYSDINAVDMHNASPLILAVRAKAEPVVKALLKAGAKLDTKNTNGDTALILALKKRFLSIIDLLIKAMIDSPQYRSSIFNERYHCNKTLLMLCIENECDIEIIKQIIPFSDINVADENMQTPLMYATKYKDVPTVKVLLAAGVKLDAKNSLGRTALWFAEVNGDKKIIDLLNPPALIGREKELIP